MLCSFKSPNKRVFVFYHPFREDIIAFADQVNERRNVLMFPTKKNSIQHRFPLSHSLCCKSTCKLLCHTVIESLYAQLIPIWTKLASWKLTPTLWLWRLSNVTVAIEWFGNWMKGFFWIFDRTIQIQYKLFRHARTWHRPKQKEKWECLSSASHQAY